MPPFVSNYSHIRQNVCQDGVLSARHGRHTEGGGGGGAESARARELLIDLIYTIGMSPLPPR